MAERAPSPPIQCAPGAHLSAGAGKDLTTLLLDWSRGDAQALDQLTPLVYQELRRIAGRELRRERPDHTLQSTAVVHEVYLKLIDQQRVQFQDRDHFFAVASQMIRRILVSYARAHKAAKRGAGVTKLLFDESIGIAGGRSADLVALDDALESLSRVDPQQGRIVELRFFGGLSIEATANVLSISPATVKRDWNVAKAWLYRELARSGGSDA
jgi:RNA polymerase sigma factor (TIGR02999 family)